MTLNPPKHPNPSQIKLNTPPKLTPKPKPAKDGWGKWYKTATKTKTFAERNQINPQATFQHTTNNLTPINNKDHYNNHLKKQLNEIETELKTSQTLHAALNRIEQTLETIHALQRNIRTLAEQHLKQQQ